MGFAGMVLSAVILTTLGYTRGVLSDLVTIDRQLARAVARLDFAPPVRYVYNPLAYAWKPHRRYLERWGGGRKEVVFLGMNPGPWGMAQTGVPFGEVAAVRDWLGIEAPVEPPQRQHPRRPVEGFGCRRSEVSGRRLWGWFRELCGTPERFFARCFVLNYCPLAFLEATGRNRTPDKLPAAERGPLEAVCDRALRRAVEALAPCWVIGVGAFAEARARRALAAAPVEIGRVLHPSPASPAANRGWSVQAGRDLAALGIDLTAFRGAGAC
jgi:single-strand selective monofunctional uracil DNA glycosylase